MFSDAVASAREDSNEQEGVILIIIVIERFKGKVRKP